MDQEQQPSFPYIQKNPEQILGYGTGYCVEVMIHPRTGSEVAVKCLFKKTLAQRYQMVQGRLKPLIISYKKSTALIPAWQTLQESYTGLIRIYGVYTTEHIVNRDDYGSIYIVQEHCCGGPSMQLVKSSATCWETSHVLKNAGWSKISVFSEIWRALRALHKNGLTHGDIKPQNIFVREDATVALGDIDTLEAVNDNSCLGPNRGTISFRPPESLDQSLSHKFAADLWSLGITLWIWTFETFPYPHWDPYTIDEEIRVFDVEIAIAAVNENKQHDDNNNLAILRLLLERDPEIRCSNCELIDRITNNSFPE